MFLGAATGLFADAPIVVANSLLTSIWAVGDFNGDDLPDVLGQRNRIVAEASVWLGDPSAGLLYSATGPWAGVEVEPGDFDDDGDDDLAVMYQVDNVTPVSGITIWEWNGDGGFTRSHVLLVDETLILRSLTVADLDGDGTKDLAAMVQEFQAASVLLWFGDGSGGFGPVVPGPSLGTGQFGIYAVELSGDAAVDLLCEQGEWNNFALINSGDGRFAVTDRVGLLARISPRAIGDWSRDGIPDLVGADPPRGWIHFLPGDGTGRFGDLV